MLVTPILGGGEDMEDTHGLRLLVQAVDHEVPMASGASMDDGLAKIRRVVRHLSVRVTVFEIKASANEEIRILTI